MRPEEPKWGGRDRFVLSKGHASPVYYAALAKRGYFPEEDLLQYRALDSKLQGHPDMRKCPGVDMTTGSLGNGVAAALGMALIGKKDHKEHMVYAVAGDGELQEGIVWEFLLYAGNAKLDNFVLVVDANGLQSGGYVRDIQNEGDLGRKFESFGWNTIEISGHDIDAIQKALDETKRTVGKPTAVIAKTLKGKAVKKYEGGKDAVVIACGPCVEEAEKAAVSLKKSGIGATVVDMHTIKPIDVDTIVEVCKDAPAVLTVEDGSIYGGLGGALAPQGPRSGLRWTS